MRNRLLSVVNINGWLRIINHFLQTYHQRYSCFPVKSVYNLLDEVKQLAARTQGTPGAESFGAEIFESQGTLKFSNREIIQLLFNNNWKCRNCDNIIKNKQNIPFSEEERKDITWAMLAKEYDLTNYDDINVVRKKTRGLIGNQL